MREKILICVIAALVLYLPIGQTMAKKDGRVEMYSEVCLTLGVDENTSVQVGDKIIMKQGIWIPPSPPPKRTDLCNACHVGGYNG